MKKETKKKKRNKPIIDTTLDDKMSLTCIEGPVKVLGICRSPLVLGKKYNSKLQNHSEPSYGDTSYTHASTEESVLQSKKKNKAYRNI